MSSLPIIVFLLFLVLPATAFLFLVFKLIMKSKNSSWTGEVIDKVHNEKKDSDSHRIEHFYYLLVRPEQGRDMKVGLSGEMWGRFEKGDKIKKEKGKLHPEKI